jgi:hypothetical protein
MNKIMLPGFWFLLVLAISSCGSEHNDAIKFAERCYQMETLLTRNTGDIVVEKARELSAADAQNGIIWRGAVTINYTIYNPRTDAWQDGKSVYNLIKKNDKFMVESGLGRACSTTTPGMEIP